jgi:hypothetical protein
MLTSPIPVHNSQKKARHQGCISYDYSTRYYSNLNEVIVQSRIKFSDKPMCDERMLFT